MFYYTKIMLQFKSMMMLIDLARVALRLALLFWSPSFWKDRVGGICFANKSFANTILLNIRYAYPPSDFTLPRALVLLPAT
jgi:hypothetical protein